MTRSPEPRRLAGSGSLGTQGGHGARAPARVGGQSRPAQAETHRDSGRDASYRGESLGELERAREAVGERARGRE